MSRLVWELHHRLDATYEPRWELREWGLYFALVSLPVMLLATLVVVVVHRRRRHGGPYIGPVGQYVGTLLGLLLPLTALTAIALLCVSIPAARQAREWANINHTIIHEGELDHYAVTAPSVP
jgi:heme/copper-type cytochrome/quinol oxidase subunit 2